jgi:hypothetical protein
MRLYIGPYVRVKVPNIDQTEYTPWCNKCDKRQGNIKFCETCGSSITMKEEKTKGPFPSWSIPATIVLRYIITVGNRIDDQLEYIYTIGNGRTDFNERQEDEDKLKLFWYGSRMHYGRTAHDLQNIDREKQIKWLQNRCCDEIEKIAEVFGEQNISYGWGIVESWN